MTKMNIRIRDGISDVVALERVLSVVKRGRISKKDTCYCYISTFSDGTVVFAETTRAGSDTFIVYREQKERDE